MKKTEKKLIVANWKMNPASEKGAILNAEKIEKAAMVSKNTDVVVAPPFPFIISVGKALKKAKLGAQDVFWEEKGAFTGEISCQQLKNINVQYVIIGHSERRIFLAESDESVNKKVNAALKNGLRAILCVGERERNVYNEIPEIVGEQLEKALDGVKKPALLKNLIVAYEPVWAISTMSGARPDTPDNAFRARMYLRKVLTKLYGATHGGSVKIIYGGSVNTGNVSGFLGEGTMQGALVGSASLDPIQFGEIVKNAGTRQPSI